MSFQQAPTEFQLAAAGDTVALRAALNKRPFAVKEWAPDTQHTLLYNAVLSNKFECVRMLVEEFKADVNQPATPYGNTPLHAAVWLGWADAAQYLLSRGATPRRNKFDEFPADQLEKACPTRSPAAAQQTLQLLRQLDMHMTKSIPAASPQALAQQQRPPYPQQQPASIVQPTSGIVPQLQVQPGQPQQQAFPASTGPVQSAESMGGLPQWCEPVRQQFPKLTWTQTAHDYTVRGLLPYAYKGATYYTPVIFFASKQVSDAVSVSSMYRCLIDVRNMGTLAVSQRATYIEPVSGAIRPQPPFRFPSFLGYILSVVELFQRTPPLAESTSAAALFVPGIVAPDRRIRMELSAFCDGALQYRPQQNSIDGVVPVYPGNNRAFKPIANVPVKISLVPTQLGAAVPDVPLVFVGPLDYDMMMAPSPIVNPTTGQVFGLPSLASWTNRSSLTTLLRELQEAFSNNVPIQCRPVEAPAASPPPPGYYGSPTAAAGTPSPQPAAASAATSSPLSSADATASDALLCVICMDEHKRFIALPCRHLLFCAKCVEEFARQPKKECPVCRSKVNDLFEIFT